mmetsp:Transcript_123095/g.173513  ORF Transcript_123095/g.173513 Transcript_123095/m.173513 type:complete len:138 (-) Transcript_123095:68-481(-)
MTRTMTFAVLSLSLIAPAVVEAVQCCLESVTITTRDYVANGYHHESITNFYAAEVVNCSGTVCNSESSCSSPHINDGMGFTIYPDHGTQVVPYDHTCWTKSLMCKTLIGRRCATSSNDYDPRVRSEATNSSNLTLFP